MKKLLALLTALCLGLCALPALAETAPEPLTAQSYIAGMNAMAEKVGGTLAWRTEPLSGYEDYTLHICTTLGDQPVLMCLGDTVVMVSTGVTYDPTLAPLGPENYLGQYIVDMTPILTARGMTEDEAFEALLPLVNEDGLVERVAQTSLDGTPSWFGVAGYRAVVLRYEDEDMLRLCLYIYTAPDLMPSTNND